MIRGFFTSEFWVSIIGMVLPMLPQVNQQASAIGPKTAAVTGAITAAAYALGRSYVKANTPDTGASTAGDQAK